MLHLNNTSVLAHFSMVTNAACPYEIFKEKFQPMHIIVAALYRF